MKNLILASCLIASVGLAVPAYAAAPLDGVYNSTDLGGTIPVGRYTESWTMPNGYLMTGNTVKAESYNGVLGTVWRYECPSIAFAPMLIVDTVNPVTGNGNQTWMKTYTGGTFWLSGTGPWANAEPEYTGVVDTYVEFETIIFSSFNRVGAVSNVQATGHFNGFPGSCVSFAVGNGAWMSDTGIMAKPPGFPPFLQKDTCTPTAVMGSWWTVSALTLTISGCAVPVEESTWGAIKSLYE
ncbi:MAG: hypothetical protein ACE5EO_05005 [Candidatus Krumholzibacteriia bacterium]